MRVPVFDLLCTGTLFFGCHTGNKFAYIFGIVWTFWWNRCKKCVLELFGLTKTVLWIWCKQYCVLYLTGAVALATNKILPQCKDLALKITWTVVHEFIMYKRIINIWLHLYMHGKIECVLKHIVMYNVNIDYIMYRQYSM